MEFSFRQRIASAFANNRIPHAFLLTSREESALEKEAFLWAKWAFKTDDPFHHPDCFVVRPTNKMRLISMDSIRDLLSEMMQTSRCNGYKLAVIYNADRLHIAAANALLKTLEEPPAQSVFLLLSTRPYELPSTVKSRCIQYQIPREVLEKSRDENTHVALEEEKDYDLWLNELQKWIETVFVARNSPASHQKNLYELLLHGYALVANFQNILASWPVEKSSKDLPDEVRVAEEESQRKALRQRCFQKFLETIWASYFPLISSEPSEMRLQINRLAQILQNVERMVQLLEVNFNETAALESIFLELWKKI